MKSKKRFNKLYWIVPTAVAACLLSGVAVFALNSGAELPTNTDYATSASLTATPTSPKPGSTTTIVVVTPAPVAPSTTVVETQICRSIISNAQTQAKNLDSQYSSNWTSWNSVYLGEYDSQAALDGKEWYKNYTKQQFANWVSSNDPTMQKFCHSSTSLADIMVQPDYSTW